MYSVPSQPHSPHGLNRHVEYCPIQYPQLPALLPPPPALGIGQYIRQEEPLDLSIDLNPSIHRAHFLEEIPFSAQITPSPAWQPPGPKFRRPTNPSAGSQRMQIAHPYARLSAKKDSGEVKGRNIWNHALEKSIFSPIQLYDEHTRQSFNWHQSDNLELRSSIGEPQRRKIYAASLEAHIDRLHAQLLKYAKTLRPLSTTNVL